MALRKISSTTLMRTKCSGQSDRSLPYRASYASSLSASLAPNTSWDRLQSDPLHVKSLRFLEHHHTSTIFLRCTVHRVSVTFATETN